MESVSFHLFTVMENIFGILARRAEEKGLELVLLIQPDLPLRWIGDPLRLEQILINLINNAIKFSNGGRVVVSVGDKERTAKNIQVQFAVQDSGVGIPRSNANGCSIHLLRRITPQRVSSGARDWGCPLLDSWCI